MMMRQKIAKDLLAQLFLVDQNSLVSLTEGHILLLFNQFVLIQHGALEYLMHLCLLILEMSCIYPQHVLKYILNCYFSIKTINDQSAKNSRLFITIQNNGLCLVNFLIRVVEDKCFRQLKSEVTNHDRPFPH
jgi:hypothetical protein